MASTDVITPNPLHHSVAKSRRNGRSPSMSAPSCAIAGAAPPSLLLDRADVAAVSRQVHLALFYDAALDIKAMGHSQ
jgi:hypothetical protein